MGSYEVNYMQNRLIFKSLYLCSANSSPLQFFWHIFHYCINYHKKFHSDQIQPGDFDELKIILQLYAFSLPCHSIAQCWTALKVVQNNFIYIEAFPSVKYPFKSSCILNNVEQNICSNISRHSTVCCWGLSC